LSLVVFRDFRALPVPVDKFCLQIYAFQTISHTFDFGVTGTEAEPVGPRPPLERTCHHDDVGVAFLFLSGKS